MHSLSLPKGWLTRPPLICSKYFLECYYFFLSCIPKEVADKARATIASAQRALLPAIGTPDATLVLLIPIPESVAGVFKSLTTIVFEKGPNLEKSGFPL